MNIEYLEFKETPPETPYMAMALAYMPGLVIHDNNGAQVVLIPLRIVRRARGNYAKHTRFDRLH